MTCRDTGARGQLQTKLLLRDNEPIGVGDIFPEQLASKGQGGEAQPTELLPELLCTHRGCFWPLTSSPVSSWSHRSSVWLSVALISTEELDRISCGQIWEIRSQLVNFYEPSANFSNFAGSHHAALHTLGPRWHQTDHPQNW